VVAVDGAGIANHALHEVVRLLHYDAMRMRVSFP
jgi:hypothetical protein